MNLYKALLIGTIIALLSTESAMAITEATVIKVSDGDTLTVRNSNKQKVVIRLACIDSAESGQPTGAEAKEYLNELLPPGTAIKVKEAATDQYERVVAQIYADGQLINLRLVALGHAVIYPAYFKPCREVGGLYHLAQDSARANKLGFWSQLNPIFPWNWRKRAVPRHVLPPGEWPACATTAAGCNCSDFKDQKEAQRLLDAIPTDPHNLDANRNLRACDSSK